MSVEEFWATVWNAPYDLDAIDRFVTPDFVITTGGEDVVSRAAFKNWIAAFLSVIDDLRIQPVETFQNHDSSQVTSRWILTGRNNGILGTALFGGPAGTYPLQHPAVIRIRKPLELPRQPAVELRAALSTAPPFTGAPP